MECTAVSQTYLEFSPNYYYVILTLWLTSAILCVYGYNQTTTETEQMFEKQEIQFEALRDILLSVHGELRAIRDATQRLRLRKRGTPTPAEETSADETHSAQE